MLEAPGKKSAGMRQAHFTLAAGPSLKKASITASIFHPDQLQAFFSCNCQFRSQTTLLEHPEIKEQLESEQQGYPMIETTTTYTLI